MKDTTGINHVMTEEVSILKQRIRELEQTEAELKRTKEALQNSEERFRSLFDTSQESILIVDRETEYFVSANPAACRQ